MTRSSSMTSCPVLRCLAPRLPVLSVGFGSVFCSMPLGRIAGPPVTPLSLTIPARKSATTCFSAAFSASRRSVRASRSPRDSSERGIFSGTDMLGTNRVRYEQGQPRSSSYLPGFLPQVLNGQQAVTAISALWLRRSTAFRWLQQPIGRHLMIDVVEQVIERHQEVKNEGISEWDDIFYRTGRFVLNRVQFETRRFQFRSSPPGRPWKVGTTGFKLDAV